MLTEISAGLNSLKAAKDILQALNGIQSANAVNEVKFNLQSHLLDAQQGLFAAQEAQAALTSRIRELEQRIVEMKDWEAEKGRYQLHDIGRGAMAYVVKPGMENGEPAHWLCVKCFSHGQKSFMQFKGQDRRPGGGNGENSTYGCDACKASLTVTFRQNPERDRVKLLENTAVAAANVENMRDSTPD